MIWKKNWLAKLGVLKKVFVQGIFLILCIPQETAWNHELQPAAEMRSVS